MHFLQAHPPARPHQAGSRACQAGRNHEAAPPEVGGVAKPEPRLQGDKTLQPLACWTVSRCDRLHGSGDRPAKGRWNPWGPTEGAGEREAEQRSWAPTSAPSRTSSPLLSFPPLQGVQMPSWKMRLRLTSDPATVPSQRSSDPQVGPRSLPATGHGDTARSSQPAGHRPPRHTAVLAAGRPHRLGGACRAQRHGQQTREPSSAPVAAQS